MKIDLNIDLKPIGEHLRRFPEFHNLQIKNVKGKIYHQNYLEYLEVCWARHFAPVLTPDIIWYTLLCEIGGIVEDNIEELRYLFSESSEKQEIVVFGSDPKAIPVEAIKKELEKKIPTEIDAFFPEFSTAHRDSRIAHYAAFADAVSPYYNYGMMMCGFPYISLKGSKEDWQLLHDKWEGLGKLFKIEKGYFSSTLKILSDICQNCRGASKSFWKNMLTCKKCGSGGEVNLNGWFTQLFRKQPKYPRKSNNFSSHVSKIDYKIIGTKNEYSRFDGILSSNLEDQELVPEFGWYSLQTNKEKPTKDEKDALKLAIQSARIITTDKLTVGPKKIGLYGKMEQGEIWIDPKLNLDDFICNIEHGKDVNHFGKLKQ